MNAQRKQQDHEANLFAMYLLVPSNLLRKEVRQLYPGGIDLMGNEVGLDEALVVLAKKFKVSCTVMRIRMSQLATEDIEP